MAGSSQPHHAILAERQSNDHTGNDVSACTYYDSDVEHHGRHNARDRDDLSGNSAQTKLISKPTPNAIELAKAPSAPTLQELNAKVSS
ncbi:hypothetical protein [Methylomicrobium sp. Wu6]|uniref:hypothetical protein n=1 Tax=Methylomicrobium sp. Wu6 TaxID=3107928 RepID=UPI002DD66E61|nr:hypothetical protein [Methylomicrobium sp. Wu6]MEC4749007.1 hypothetical protein [Methylomicrobium sp. Wu6]